MPSGKCYSGSEGWGWDEGTANAYLRVPSVPSPFSHWTSSDTPSAARRIIDSAQPRHVVAFHLPSISVSEVLLTHLQGWRAHALPRWFALLLGSLDHEKHFL